MEDASWTLQQTLPAVEKAKTSLAEGTASRQKHIRIADRSEFGWATVEEYVEDELAEGEDDEKRIQRADLRARKKFKSAKGAKNKKGPASQFSRKAQNVVAQSGRMPGPSSGMPANRNLVL